MSRICPVTKRRRHKANSVSHANNRTRKWQYPGLRNKRLFNEETGQWVCVRVSPRGMRTISKKGLGVVLREAEAK